MKPRGDKEIAVSLDSKGFLLNNPPLKSARQGWSTKKGQYVVKQAFHNFEEK